MVNRTDAECMQLAREMLEKGDGVGAYSELYGIENKKLPGYEDLKKIAAEARDNQIIEQARKKFESGNASEAKETLRGVFDHRNPAFLELKTAMGEKPRDLTNFFSTGREVSEPLQTTDADLLRQAWEEMDEGDTTSAYYTLNCIKGKDTEGFKDAKEFCTQMEREDEWGILKGKPRTIENVLINHVYMQGLFEDESKEVVENLKKSWSSMDGHWGDLARHQDPAFIEKLKEFTAPESFRVLGKRHDKRTVSSASKAEGPK